jgi:protein-L-isoaspartate(D-aspartate) O-methyltransferase
LIYHTRDIIVVARLGFLSGFWPLVFFAIFGYTGIQAQQDFEEQRSLMVQIQLMGRDITDKATLLAMETVERHKFVPDKVREWSYADRPLPIGEGQTISQPYIVAFMTQALNLEPGDKVLEIGTGSGYQAAVLAEIADSVYTIEIVRALGLAAEKRLGAMGYSNTRVRVGDGYHGWPEAAPFDAIMVTAGAETVPHPLLEQLKDGGRMVIPVGPHRGVRQLKLFRRKGDRFREKNLMDVRFVPFIREKE